MRSLFLFVLLYCGLTLYGQQAASPLFEVQSLEAFIATEPTAKRAGEILLGAVRIGSWEDVDKAELSLTGHFALSASATTKNAFSAGTRTLSGALDELEGGYFILAETDGVVFGKIEAGDGTVYLLRPGKKDPSVSGVYATFSSNIVEDCVESHDEGPPFTPEEKPTDAGEKAANVCSTTATCSTQSLAVMMVYTDDVQTELGGAAAVSSAFAVAIEEANTTNANSGIDHRFELVHIEKVNYTESNSLSTDLDALETAYDGTIDGIHEVRAKKYADLVAMIVSDGGCGLGNTNGDEAQYDAMTAFSVTGLNCMLTNKSLTHEIGHNMGFRHDRPNSTGNNFSCNIEWGWVNEVAFTSGVTNDRWRTIMAYNNQCADAGFTCSRVLQWSNPDVDFRGNPTGSPRGQSDAADNAGIMQLAACQVADFRTRPCDDCTIYQDCELLNANTANGPGNQTTLRITDAPTSVPNGAAVELCVYLFGDFNNTSERMDVIGEGNVNLGPTVVGFDCDVPTRTCFTLSESQANSWLANGTMTINLNPRGTAINPRLCTRLNQACAELTVTGGSSGSPELVESGYIIDDDNNQSSGNGNGVVNPGETIELPVFVRNTGTAEATGVSATLSTTDGFVTGISDNFENWPNIAANAREKCVYDFDFTVAANTPSRDIRFTLQINSDQGSWTETFTVPVVGNSQPELAPDGYIIDDDNSSSSGNNNGVVNPGETIELPVFIRNTGNATATNVSATISTTDGFVTNISDNFEEWPNIAAGAREKCVFDYDFTVAANTPSRNIVFTMQITSDQGSWTETLTVPVVGNGANLTVDGFTVDDDNSTSSGNDNGVANPGETIELPVFLLNTGNQTATNVQATLSTNDGFITNITDAVENWPDIAPGARVKCVYDYDFTISGSTPNRNIVFILAITSSQGNWTRNFTLPVSANSLDTPDGGGTTSAADAPVTSLKVYPNPATDVVRIQTSLTADAPFTLITATGKQVNQGILNAGATKSLDVSRLPAGVYFLRVVDGAEQLVERVVIR